MSNAARRALRPWIEDGAKLLLVFGSFLIIWALAPLFIGA